MKIIVVSGSARPQRQSHQVALALLDQLQELGHTTELLDVKALNFPLLEQTFAKMEDPPEKMKQVSESIRACDGLILVSPEYNGSYSGALKNTLDYFYIEYSRKPFGIVTVSDGKLGGISAAKNLLQYAQTLQGFVLPNFLLTPRVQELFTDGKLTDEKYAKTMQQFLHRFLWLSDTVSVGKK